MDFKSLTDLLGNVPFAIIVASFLLYRLEGVLRELVAAEAAERELLIEIRDALHEFRAK